MVKTVAFMLCASHHNIFQFENQSCFTVCTTGLKENEKQMSWPRVVTIPEAMTRTRAEGGSVPVCTGEMGKASNQGSRRVAGGWGGMEELWGWRGPRP